MMWWRNSLSRCKGGCCESGDAGAPLEEEELEIVVNLSEIIKPYLTEASIAEIEKKGNYVYHKEFGWVTPTPGDGHQLCVYGSRDEMGIIQCAFEEAYNDGVTDPVAAGWIKPISCHLFLVIAKKGKNGNYNRVNYEPRRTYVQRGEPKKNLCNPACALGEKEKVPVYKFLKEALIRMYGEDFYNTLDKVANEYYQEIEQKINY